VQREGRAETADAHVAAANGRRYGHIHGEQRMPAFAVLRGIALAAVEHVDHVVARQCLPMLPGCTAAGRAIRPKDNVKPAPDLKH